MLDARDKTLREACESGPARHGGEQEWGWEFTPTAEEQVQSTGVPHL